MYTERERERDITRKLDDPSSNLWELGWFNLLLFAAFHRPPLPKVPKINHFWTGCASPKKPLVTTALGSQLCCKVSRGGETIEKSPELSTLQTLEVIGFGADLAWIWIVVSDERYESGGRNALLGQLKEILTSPPSSP